ncbi:ATP-binding protein [Maribacter litoralis]|uniref:histidine kinase n=1 Tax=Maribacter litoralis TaxID=2059726 RepID=A0A653X840_9FLAO|nr:ATP-binding protein [Maribacter litoralis]VXC27234.1 Integral membrane sensor signal transduction histidine kinase [Maribacter litoralis]
MLHILFAKKSFPIVFLLVLVCTTKLLGQSEKSTLNKINELRLASNFKPKSPQYIDLILELAKEKIRENPDTTAILLKEGLDLSLKSNYRAGESRALSTYGYYYFEKGEKDKALDHNLKALNIAEKYNLGAEKLKALNNMGLDYTIQGEDALALTQFLEALEVADKIGDIGMSININVSIGTLYGKNGDYQTAATFLDIARDLSLESEDNKALPYTFLNMASQYADMGNYERANELIDKSIVFFEKKNIKDWLSHSYEQKGSIALRQKQYERALKYLLKAEELCDKLNFTYGYALVYLALSKCYLGLDNIDKAEYYGLKSLEFGEDLNVENVIKESNSILAQTYHRKGDNTLAYNYQTAYLELYKIGADEKFKKGLGILRSKMEFENQKKQLIVEKNKEITKQKKYIYITIGALVLLLIFLISVYRTNKLQKKYTQELQEKQEILLQHETELSEANKTKDKLFSIIAHDLRGPINSFYGLLELSLTEQMTKEQYNVLIPKALNNIQGISVMLNNLLEWAKAQMNGIVVEPRELEINSVLENTIKVLTPLASKKDIKIVNEVPDTKCFSDQNHLTIILRNLISNAIKFTHVNGTINISATRKDDFLEVAVSDNGIGMSTKKVEQLFKNAHVDSTFGTNNEKGTGLGLFLCKEMAESNGGKLWVTSIENVGTTVFFTVPLHK